MAKTVVAAEADMLSTARREYRGDAGKRTPGSALAGLALADSWDERGRWVFNAVRAAAPQN